MISYQYLTKKSVIILAGRIVVVNSRITYSIILIFRLCLLSDGRVAFYGERLMAYNFFAKFHYCFLI